MLILLTLVIRKLIRKVLSVKNKITKPLQKEQYEIKAIHFGY
nr:MAG TPA: hypothetical protein [Caudoviricetes sp.]